VQSANLHEFVIIGDQNISRVQISVGEIIYIQYYYSAVMRKNEIRNNLRKEEEKNK